jgi:large subunit ribosomal protein L24
MSKDRFKSKYKIKRDDTVIVVAGNDKGSEGRVLEITGDGRVVVEGVNVIKKATRPNPQFPNGGIVDKEAPIQMSNVQLKDPKTGGPTRVGRRVEDGKIVRYAKKSGQVID